MSEGTRARAARWLTGPGIEIGALNRPLVVPPDATVQYVDRGSLGDLRSQYPELASAELVAPSVIGDAHDLSALGDRTVQFVIANHVVEHLEDPIRGLSEMYRVTRTGGIMYLAVPDPRGSFDVDRPLTTLAHCVNEYRHGTARTRRRHYEEWVEKAEPHIEWMRAARVPSGRGRVDALMATAYSIHFHVWLPLSFLTLVEAAREEAKLDMDLVEFHPCVDGDDEFVCVFMKERGRRLGTVPRLAEESEILRLGAELASALGSRSWRGTAPLRKLSGAVRRIRR